jgi:uncharacterized protein
MSKAARIIVADAGPLMGLAKCGQLALLKQLFEAVHIPQQVVIEVTARSKPFADVIDQFIGQHTVIEGARDNDLSEKLKKRLGAGEIQAICCGLDLACPVLMDDKKGRLIAQANGVAIIGLLGLLLLAKREGHVQKVAPLIEALLVQKYLLGEELISQVLLLAGEN